MRLSMRTAKPPSMEFRRADVSSRTDILCGRQHETFVILEISGRERIRPSWDPRRPGVHVPPHRDPPPTTDACRAKGRVPVASTSSAGVLVGPAGASRATAACSATSADRLRDGKHQRDPSRKRVGSLKPHTSGARRFRAARSCPVCCCRIRLP